MSFAALDNYLKRVRLERLKEMKCLLQCAGTPESRTIRVEGSAPVQLKPQSRSIAVSITNLGPGTAEIYEDGALIRILAQNEDAEIGTGRLRVAAISTGCDLICFTLTGCRCGQPDLYEDLDFEPIIGGWLL